MNGWQRPASLLLSILLLGLATQTLAAPSAKLWQRWNAFDPDSIAVIDHSAWNRWLAVYLTGGGDGINRVAYDRVSADDRKQLKDYIEALSAVAISAYNRAEQRAYWINLYNALTIDIVLEHYPLESIRDISSGLFSSGPWRLKLARIENEKLTLDDIEHRILRPIWRDPRIHYAVNCASLGCPNLQPLAFTADNSESLLEQAARDFVNSERGARVVDGRLEVSSIYHWFEEDFGGDDAGVIAHLRQYADPELSAALSNIDRIDDHDYDWRINAAK
ncbi:MAG: DUF547 domain-containing protein [Gammaproteobacteria bacterium]|nr:MAG: DUF547 domain-containing protein [Gammaproteobacteria bacterium]UCH40400.1 MAG: DUF547 domain-containing protein [Gammaproteobacteria bacterium]